MAQCRELNAPDYKKPPTLPLWIVGIYAALYGIASTHYEATLDRVENRMSALASQLSTGNDDAFKRLIEQIPRIQGMKTPPEPKLLQPFSIFFPLLSEEPNPEILEWTQETIESWQDRLAKLRPAGVDLAGINLSGAMLQETDLSGLDLDKANLFGAELDRANLSGTRFREANLSRARLAEADLSGADLYRANLFRTELDRANLSGIRFLEADLSKARLADANLSDANLHRANLSGAELNRADFSEAKLLDANLSRAELSGIQNWKEIKYIRGTNILGVVDAPEGFREWALERGAVEMETEAWMAKHSGL